MIRRILETINEAADTYETFEKLMRKSGWTYRLDTPEDHDGIRLHELGRWVHPNYEGVSVHTISLNGVVQTIVIRMILDRPLVDEQYGYDMLTGSEANFKDMMKAIRRLYSEYGP